MNTPKMTKFSMSKLLVSILSAVSIPPILFFYLHESMSAFLGKQISEIGAISIAILIILIIATTTLSILLFIKNKKMREYINEYGIPVKIGFVTVKPEE